jgi:hypothetical protein
MLHLLLDIGLGLGVSLALTVVGLALNHLIRKLRS